MQGQGPDEHEQHCVAGQVPGNGKAANTGQDCLHLRDCVLALLREGLATSTKNHMKRLYKMVVNAGISIPEVGEKSLDTSMVEVKFRQLSCLRMRW